MFEEYVGGDPVLATTKRKKGMTVEQAVEKIQARVTAKCGVVVKAKFLVNHEKGCPACKSSK